MCQVLNNLNTNQSWSDLTSEAGGGKEEVRREEEVMMELIPRAGMGQAVGRGQYVTVSRITICRTDLTTHHHHLHQAIGHSARNILNSIIFFIEACQTTLPAAGQINMIGLRLVL